RFILSRQEIDLEAAYFFCLREKFRTVFRIAHGCRSHDDECIDADAIAKRHETPQPLKSTLHAFGIATPGRGERAAKARHDFFVEDENRVARGGRIDHEAHGIRADIDDAKPPAEFAAAHSAPPAFSRKTDLCRLDFEFGRKVVLERGSTPGETRVVHEIGVSIKGLLALPQAASAVGPIRLQFVTLLVVFQIGNHDLVQNLIMDRGIEDRHHDLTPPVEVTRHPVRRGDIDLGLVIRQTISVAETDDTGMLKEAPDNALYTDIFRKPRYPR